MAGTLVITTLSDGTNSTSATNCIQGSAKAWVNFNGSTATSRASYNVSSITRNGNCDYTVNFTNAFADANYSTVATANAATGQGACATLAFGGLGGTAGSLYSTTQVEIFVQNTNATRSTDVTMLNVACFR
jgi:hypothetical protein